jgi:hypothetical protein
MDSFEWHSAALSDLRVPVAVAALYAGGCATHRLLHGESPPQSALWRHVEGFLPYHNLFLAVLSLVMFVGCSWAVLEKCIRLQSADWMFCEDVDVPDTGALEFWSYIYYLSKFYELLDTILQLIRGRYPPHYLLHAYHHSGVLMMCWAWLQYRPSLRHIGLMFNVFVHIPMYYYFYLKSRNVDPWWKRYVTKLQIFQFMFSLAVFAWTLFLVVGQGRTCNNMSYLYIQLFFNVSLLLGFLGVLSTGTKKSPASGNSTSKKGEKAS